MARGHNGRRSCSILLAQRQTLMREVFIQLLQDVPELRIVDHTDGIDAAATLAAVARPDVVVVDSLCVDEEGAAALTRIKSASADSSVLLLTDEVDHGQIATAFACGVDGVVLKSVSVQALVDTIQRLVRRGPVPARPNAQLGSA